jgi:uncharacterized protein (UPF0332 family)
MFYAVLALLQKVGKVPRKHSGAISLFDTEFVRKGRLLVVQFLFSISLIAPSDNDTLLFITMC